MNLACSQWKLTHKVDRLHTKGLLRVLGLTRSDILPLGGKSLDDNWAGRWDELLALVHERRRTLSASIAPRRLGDNQDPARQLNQVVSALRRRIRRKMRPVLIADPTCATLA